MYADFPGAKSTNVDHAPRPNGAANADATHELGVYVKNSLIKEVPRPEAFKATLESLIESGSIIAVGENAIERVFADAGSFGEYFDALGATANKRVDAVRGM